MSEERRVTLSGAEVERDFDRLGGAAEQYEVTIKRVTVIPRAAREWLQVGVKPREKSYPVSEDTPAMVPEYGYVDRVRKETDTVILYQQTVAALDVRAVIAAVNATKSC